MKILGHQLSDLLMYSQEIYYNQIIMMNREMWPAVLAAAATSLILLYVSLTQAGWLHNWLHRVVALSWLSSAVLFHFLTYAPINWLAYVYAVFFVLQAGFMWLPASQNRATYNSSSPDIVAMAILVYATLIHPVISISINGLQGIEVFAIHPTPTLLATLAFLLYQRAAVLLYTIPLLYAVVETTLASELGSYEVSATLGGCFLVFFTLLFRKYEKIKG